MHKVWNLLKPGKSLLLGATRTRQTGSCREISIEKIFAIIYTMKERTVKNQTNNVATAISIHN